MAKKTVTVLIDDLTGDELTSGETVTFALDGTSYDIDLSDKNAAALRKVLAPYIAAGTRQSGANRGRASGPKPAEIREWAKRNGFPDLPDRGRIPADVMDAWNNK